MKRHPVSARTVLLTLGAAIGLGVAPAGAATADDGLRAGRDRPDHQMVPVPARTPYWPGRARVGSETEGGHMVLTGTAATAAARRAELARLRLDEADRIYRHSVAEVEQARERVRSLADAAYRPSPWMAGNPASIASLPVGVVDRASYLDLLDAQRVQVEALTALAEAQALLRARAAALAAALGEREDSSRRYQAAPTDQQPVDKRIPDRGAVRDKRAASSRQAPRPAPTAPLLMPVDGRKSSDYGNRLNPYSNTWRFHAGVDIAAPGGTPIRAAADGTVTRAGWNGGYGNYTCLAHGDGLSTCYAHQSQILVEAGQEVRRGQVIGRVGTTGNSTGNHLHFEVRRDGSPVDPTAYLPPLN